MVKLEIFVPITHLDQISKALRSVGAGAIGNYDSVLSYSPVKGRWRPLPGADPYDGTVGELSEADEYKVEVCCRKEDVDETLRAIQKAHPYEVPVINAIPLIKTGLDY